MEIRLTDLSTDRPIVESDGSLSLQSRAYFRAITDRALIIGTGAPEGVVFGVQGAQFLDDAGITGSILYVKRDADIAGDKTKGWVSI